MFKGRSERLEGHAQELGKLWRVDMITYRPVRVSGSVTRDNGDTEVEMYGFRERPLYLEDGTHPVEGFVVVENKLRIPSLAAIVSVEQGRNGSRDFERETARAGRGVVHVATQLGALDYAMENRVVFAAEDPYWPQYLPDLR